MLNVSELLPEAVSTDSLTAVAQAGIVGSNGESSITVEERLMAGLPDGEVGLSGNEMVEASQASGGCAQSTDGVSVLDGQAQPTECPLDSLPPSMDTDVIGSKDDGASALVACSHSAILAAPMLYQLVAVANHYGGSYVCATVHLSAQAVMAGTTRLSVGAVDSGIFSTTSTRRRHRLRRWRPMRPIA